MILRRTIGFTLLCPALIAVGTATAQMPDSVPRYELPEVTATATRSRVDRNEVSNRVDVVTEVELRESPARSVAEAVRSHLAVDIISYPGLLSGVSVRGFRPQISGISPRTLLLLDGRPAGTTNPDLLDVGNVERIEVLRGPASALYGSSAMGGVINVITRKSAGELDGAASGSYGQFGLYEAGVRIGGGLTESIDFDLSARALGRLGGYRPGEHRTFATDSLRKTLGDGTVSRLPWVSADSVIDFARYDSQAASLRFGYRIDDRWRVDASAEGYQAAGVENPGDLAQLSYDSRSLKDLARASTEVRLGGETGLHAPTIKVYASRETTDYYSAPTPPHMVNFRTPIDAWGVQAQDVVDLGAHSVIFGVDLHRASASSEVFAGEGVRAAPYAPDSAIRSTAAFGQGRGSLAGGRLTLTAGVRADQVAFQVLETPNLPTSIPNTDSRLVFSPSAGASVHATPGFRLFGNVGRAFVAPDPFFVAGYSEQRAGADRAAVFVTRGNAELRPETSRTFDLGVSIGRAGAPFHAEAAYFDTDVTDRIAAVFNTGPLGTTSAGDTILSSTSYTNADQATIRGVEARFGYDFGLAAGWSKELRIFGNATHFLEADERVGTVTGRILNIADLTAVGGISYDDFSLFAGQLLGRYVGGRLDNDYVAWWEPGTIEYPAYLVFDLTGRIRLGADYSVGVELRNLTDEDYFEVRGYNLPGRSLGLTAQVAF